MKELNKKGVSNSDKSIIIQKEYDNYGVQKISMPNLNEVIGGTKTKIYCQDTMLEMHPCN